MVGQAIRGQFLNNGWVVGQWVDTGWAHKDRQVVDNGWATYCLGKVLIMLRQIHGWAIG